MEILSWLIANVGPFVWTQWLEKKRLTYALYVFNICNWAWMKIKKKQRCSLCHNLLFHCYHIRWLATSLFAKAQIFFYWLFTSDYVLCKIKRTRNRSCNPLYEKWWQRHHKRKWRKIIDYGFVCFFSSTVCCHLWMCVRRSLPFSEPQQQRRRVQRFSPGTSN